MATQLRKSHRLSKPRIKFILGRWEMFSSYITNTELAACADRWCEQMNSGAHRLSKALANLRK